MSGSLGTWPISPAANPAKPGPVGDEAFEVLLGADRNELRARPSIHVDELREHELDSALLHLLPHGIDGGSTHSSASPRIFRARNPRERIPIRRKAEHVEA